MGANQLTVVSGGANPGRRQVPGTDPYELVLELTRAENAADPYGFHFEEQEYRLRVGGGGTRSASFPWNEKLLADLRALAQETPDPEAARRLGEQLRRFLDELDWGGHEHVLEGRGEVPSELRVVIRSSAAELYALPWELVTLKDSGQHLTELPGCTLSYEWPKEYPGAPHTAAVREGRVLFAWSSAGGAIPLEGHLHALQQASQEADFAFDAQRDVLPRVSLSSLEEQMRSSPEPVSVLHLLCHGAQLGTEEEGLYGLAWNGAGDGGEVGWVDGGALSAVLAPYADTLRMVVLCACHGGDAGKLASYLGGVAQALHRVGIDMVVASRLPLSSSGSVLLAETLYRKLLVESCSLEEALSAARRGLRVAGSGFDWASLQLYARREPGWDLRPVELRPYRGLLAFEPKHRRFFFGRKKLEAKLLERACQAVRGQVPRFQVVAGASGAGKSSVVMAGLVPLLPEEEWDWLRVRPGELVHSGQSGSGKHSAALRELQQWVRRMGGSETTAPEEGNTRELLAAAWRLRHDRPQRRLLLVVDQLEEVFTQLERRECEALMQGLWALAREPGLGCVVVATLRVDYFERCGEVMLDEQTRLDVVVYAEEHRLFVAQMGMEEMAEVIELPARRVGLRLEAGLVDRLRRDVGHEPGALPLLEHALDLLWQRRKGRWLTHRAYEQMEGVTSALTLTAERLYAELSKDERQQVRRLLVRLVTVRDVSSPRVRGRIWVDEVRPREGEERRAFDAVLERLVRSRLLVMGSAGGEGARGDGASVQLAHETLLRRWKRLKQWIEKDWEREQQRRELEAWAEDWERHLEETDGGGSYLLTGNRLSHAQGLSERLGGELSPRSQRLLEASLAAEARRRRSELSRREKERETMQALSKARLRAARFFRAGFAVAVALLAVAIVAVVIVARLREQEVRLRKQERELHKVAQSTARILLAEQFRNQDPAKALLFLRHVGSAEENPRWLRTVIDILQQPVRKAVLRGHMGEVLSAVFSPDGRRVVTASADGTARIWSVEGALLATLRGHGAGVRTATFSPDGQRVVTASADGTARVWSADGGMLAELKGHGGGVSSAVFSPDGSRVVTASVDGTARIWSAEGKALAELKGHAGRVWAAAFSPDGRRVVTASADGTARVWSPEGRVLGTLKGHGGMVYGAAFSPDGTQVVTASADGTARVWRMEGRLVAELVADGSVVNVAVFSSDGRRVVTASADGVARVWRADGRLLAELRGHGGDVKTAAFSPDGRRVVTASADGTARVWNADGGMLAELKGHGGTVNAAAFSPEGTRMVTVSVDGTARLWSADGGLQVALRGHGSTVGSAAFSADGRRVVTASADGTARIWNVQGEQVAELRGHGDGVNSAAFSSDGQRVVTASADGTARVWRAQGGMLAKLRGHAGAVNAAAFSLDGQQVVTASADGTARVWRAEGDLLAELKGHGGGVKTAAFSPDGTRVVTVSVSGAARLWRSKGELVAELKGHAGAVNSAAFSLDGQRVVTASADGTARIWNIHGKQVAELKGHGSDVEMATFSPDGRRVVTASADGTARVWRPEGGLLSTLEGHESSVRTAAFSPDGRRVVTASADGTARVWSSEGGLLAVLGGHDGSVRTAAFSPDGTRVVTVADDGTARVWPVSARLLKEILEATARDCLSAEERQSYLDEAPEEARAGQDLCQRTHGSQI